jgi:hypothetical protein
VYRFDPCSGVTNAEVDCSISVLFPPQVSVVVGLDGCGVKVFGILLAQGR